MDPAGQPLVWRYDPGALQLIDVSGDPFDEQLVAAVQKAAQTGRRRTALIGYTWTPSDWSLARVARLRRTSESASKQQYVGFLKEKYAYSIERVNDLYGLESTSFTDLLTDPFAKLDATRPAVVADDREFLAESAARLAESVALALRETHPHALLFSETLASPEAAVAMAPHVDVLVSAHPVPTAKAQILLARPPEPMPPNIIGFADPIPPK